MESPLRQLLLQTLENLLFSSHLQTDTLFCVGKLCKKEMPKSSKGLGT